MSVLLADDERLVREGLRTLLELSDGLQVVGEASDGDQVAEAVAGRPVDVCCWKLRTMAVAPALMLTTFGEPELLRGGRAGVRDRTLAVLKAIESGLI